MPVAHSRWILATTILASSLAFIDGSVVNVGLPAIGRSLVAGGAGLSWVINGYLLPLSALLLIGGAAGDRFGRRRVLILGVALFSLASLMCGLASTLSWLIAGRISQGIGAALLMPNSLAILGSTFSGEARGRAVGTWAAVGAAAGALAPLLGGWLIDHGGWRAIFLMNLPVAMAAIVLAARYVPHEQAKTGPSLDLAGAAYVAAGLAALTWGLTVNASIMLGVSVVLLTAFLVVERRRGQQAMLPLSLFSSRSFIGLNLLTFLLYGALGGLLILIPCILIEANGYTATAAGAALLPLPLVIAMTSSWMGQIAARIGPRLPLSVGAVIVAIGCVLAMRIGSAGTYWSTTLPALLAISIGMAGAVSPLTTAVLSSVEPQHTGVASGLNSAVARSGGLIATALASVVLAAHGVALLDAFRLAMVIGGAAAAAAAASAFLTVGSTDRRRDVCGSSPHKAAGRPGDCG